MLSIFLIGVAVVTLYLLWKNEREYEEFRLKSDREIKESIERFRAAVNAFIDANTDDRK